MDTSSLESVYERILEMAASSDFAAPAEGWPAELVLAHLAVNDDALIDALRDVLANKPTHRYDNSAAIDEERLRAQGGLAEVIDKLRTSSRQVCDLARQLGPLEDTPVEVHIKDGDDMVIDGETWPIGRLVQVHGEMHLPGHLSQLEGLRS
jgi:hypothetical protein